jgi:carbamoyl-phosphate synthase small subunit
MRAAIGTSLTGEVERHLVPQVSTTQIEIHGNGAKRVIAVDCGMKAHILRELTQLKITVLRVPYNYDYTHEEYDGVFLSNGPGDPTECQETIAVLKKAMKKEKPIFGICLGAQILALAADATTYKLPFGHRGQNQPCVNLATRRCYMTSQNHGYAVDARSLSREWEVTFKNLNDGSVEGISHKEKPFFAVQFHPEATPGPTDTRWLFEQFYQLL